MSKFKLTQTAAEVQDILNNSLQKPTGLAKTKLVGVGVNGQENIEIGDNLTLANGKLAATGGGSVNGLESDAEGNLTASKNLGVDGKLTLKSLVSKDNKDGDITKQLAKKIYSHTLTATDDSKGVVVFTVYSSIYYQIDASDVCNFVLNTGSGVSATGIVNIDGSNKMITSVYVNQHDRLLATWIDTSDRTTGEILIDHFKNVKDQVSPVY